MAPALSGRIGLQIINFHSFRYPVAILHLWQSWEIRIKFAPLLPLDYDRSESEGLLYEQWRTSQSGLEETETQHTRRALGNTKLGLAECGDMDRQLQQCSCPVAEAT